jgi:hypothetical protein
MEVRGGEESQEVAEVDELGLVNSVAEHLDAP